MKRKRGGFENLILRYLILLLVGLPNLGIFYVIFTPLTLYPVYFLLSIFFDVSLIGNVMLIERCFSIELIDACIAGSAYYLLTILNLSTPNIKIPKRIKMLLWAFAAFLFINILRILLLGLLSISESPLFNFTHEFFWYFVSIVMVIGIWFAEVKLFKIKDIPFYSDLKVLYKKSFMKK